MITDAKLAELKAAQTKADTLRNELGISRPGEIIFLSSVDSFSDDLAVVAADGFGGAKLSIVSGNFPIDYFTKRETIYEEETVALEEAERIAF